MRILKTWAACDRPALQRLLGRSVLDRKIEQQVRAIIDEVERRGDKALAAYTERFDRVRLTPADFRVTRELLRRARRGADREFVSAFREIRRNLLSFHRRQRPKDWRMDASGGSTLGERWLPLERVGIYVPGGKAPLVSTVLMGVVPATVAGVKEIAVFSPPGRDGEINRVVLAACSILGVEEVYRVGGAQAIAAMALGTKTVRNVDKIFGPGNIYVTMAKKLLYGRVGIDILAGPSELLVLADEAANPTFVAADLLSQAEHGTGDEVCVLATDSLPLAKRVQRELERLTTPEENAAFGNHTLLSSITVVAARSLDGAVKFANDFAAEHVEVMVKQASSVAKRITNAGAVFVGDYSPVPVGDFYAGPNHVLPTGGAARFLSGLSVLDFMRRVSVIRYSKKSLQTSLSAVSKMAQVERLLGHAEAVRIRFDRGRK